MTGCWQLSRHSRPFSPSVRHLGGLPGKTEDALTWHCVAVWAKKPRRALAETQHPPSHHQTPTGHPLMLSSHFQGYLGICMALSTKTPRASTKPLAYSECMWSIISLDIQVRFCVRGPCCLCEVISALCGIFLFLGTNNVMRLKMHGFKMELSFQTSPVWKDTSLLCLYEQPRVTGTSSFALNHYEY